MYIQANLPLQRMRRRNPRGMGELISQRFDLPAIPVRRGAYLSTRALGDAASDAAALTVPYDASIYVGSGADSIPPYDPVTGMATDGSGTSIYTAPSSSSIWSTIGKLLGTAPTVTKITGPSGQVVTVSPWTGKVVSYTPPTTASSLGAWLSTNFLYVAAGGGALLLLATMSGKKRR